MKTENRNNETDVANDERLCDLEFPLKPWKLFGGSTLMVIGMVVVLTLVSRGATSLKQFAINFASVLGVMVIFLVIRWFFRRKTTSSIQFCATHLRIPKHAESDQVVEIPYEEVHSFACVGKRRMERWLIGTSTRTFAFSLSNFMEGHSAVDRMMAELRRRISETPRGAELVRDLDRREQLRQSLLRRKPIVTHGVLGIMLILFLMQQMLSSTDGPLSLVRYGLNSSTLVGDGQFFRLVAGNFLNGNYKSAPSIFTMGTLSIFTWWLGSSVERLVGSWRFIIVFFFTGISASLCSLLIPIEQFLGAWGTGVAMSVFWLMISRKFRHGLPAEFRNSIRLTAFFLGIPILMSFSFPIETLNGVVVFVCAIIGALFPLVMFRSGSPIDDLQRSPSMFVKVTAVTTLLVVAAGVGNAIVYATKPHIADEVLVAKDLLDRNPRSTKTPKLVHAHLETYVKDSTTTVSDFTLLQPLAEKLVKLHPQNADYLSTLVTIRSRRGDTEKVLLDKDSSALP